MVKKLITVALLLGCYAWGYAQYKIEVSPHKPHHIEARLSDFFKTKDNFLMNLPLTFNITDKNVLIIMVGDDATLAYGQSVWFFSKDMDFAEFMKNNPNISASKTFKNQNEVLHKILPYNEKMIWYRTLEDGYETVKKNAKPIFFELMNLSPNQSLKFSLQFYVSQPESKIPYQFFAKCKPIDIELTVKP